jgi:hypothetical protein
MNLETISPQLADNHILIPSPFGPLSLIEKSNTELSAETLDQRVVDKSSTVRGGAYSRWPCVNHIIDKPTLATGMLSQNSFY